MSEESSKAAHALGAVADRVLTRVQANHDEQVRFLRSLVRQRSVRGAEAGVQQLIAAELRGLGLPVEQYDVDVAAISDHPGFSPTEWAYEGRPNVAATLAGAGGGRSLVLQGHVDVVPVTPERFWTRPPWEGEVEGGRLFGRGAADMKGGISAMLFAVRALKEAGVELAGDLHVDTVIEEECTGNGALASLARAAPGRRADAAIIPEPFDQTALVAQVGVVWARVTVRGSGAHVLGAEQESAVNAVLKARVVLEAIEELEREANAAPGRPAPYQDLPHPLNFNVGTFHAGDWPSTVPSECVLEVRLSTFPGRSLEELKRRFEAGLARAASADAWLRRHPPEVEYFDFNAEGFVLDPATPIIGALRAAHERLMGAPLEEYVATATTDARHYNLYYDVPATCYGPVGGNLHAPDEWVDLASLQDTTGVLALTVMEWCGVRARGG